MSIKRLLCEELPKPGQSTLLPKSEADHAIKVLRLRDGDSVQVLNGQGSAVIAKLRLKGKITTLEFDQPIQLPNGVVPLTLEMAILKGSAMEWVIEKAVELGVRVFVPLLTQTTVVQLGKKGPEEFQLRWQKIADQALKQCSRSQRMKVDVPKPIEIQIRDQPGAPDSPRLWFDEALVNEINVHFIDWYQKRKSPPQAITLLIGPEGGWSTIERNLLMSSPNTEHLSLGPLILRAETAAIHSVSLATAFLKLPY